MYHAITTSLLRLALVSSLSFYGSLSAMGGAEKGNITLEPSYTELESEGELFEGTLYEGSQEYTFKELSFGGKTELSNIRMEGSSSTTNIKLADIKEIKVTDASYESKTFPDQEFCLVTTVAHNGEETSGLLVPRKMNVSIKLQDTNFEKAWFFNKVDRIVIEPASSIKESPEGHTVAMKKEPSLEDSLMAKASYGISSVVSAMKWMGNNLVEMGKKVGSTISSLVG